MCNDDGAEDKCIHLFPKYWNEVHFLVGNEIYVYKGEDIYQENLYLSKQMISFVKYPGYPMGVTPQNEAAQTMKEREIIFGKSRKLLAFSPSTCLLMMYLLW